MGVFSASHQPIECFCILCVSVLGSVMFSAPGPPGPPPVEQDGRLAVLAGSVASCSVAVANLLPLTGIFIIHCL